tara:strand:+ start:60 stop:881 length:822 start_codon:yes stop_codon:yes gene_type:complete
LIKVNFHNQKVNLFNIASFAYSKKIEHSLLLTEAFNQEALSTDDNKLLLSFIESTKDKKNIKSQLYQDVFAAFIIGEKFDKTFLEFGATNGFDLSNSYMLEKSLGWKGTLSEPSTQWHDDLKKNRPFSDIITDCIWSESGKELNFFISDVGVLSTLDAFKENDRLSMPGNTDARIKSGKNISVKTISLNDVIQKNFKGRTPSYISIDTEGSEYQILSTFDLSKFRPVFFTVEHNFTNQQEKIDDLMKTNNYIRVFKNITAFDAWYVSAEKLRI